jgi:predicted DNA-binding ribbon-helix-helix protein
MAPATTISVPVETRDLLNELARAEGISTSALVSRIAERERDKLLLEAMNAGFAALREDGGAWDEHKADTEAWDDAAPPL